MYPNALHYKGLSHILRNTTKTKKLSFVFTENVDYAIIYIG